MQTYRTLLSTQDGGILRIRLNRPERRNALTGEMIRELTEALQAAAASDAGVLILSGAGHAFCSGLDLAELEAMAGNTPEQHREDSIAIAQMLRTLYDLPVPTIAAVHGPAVAGGMGIATLCDFTLATPESRFGYTEVRIGFIPAIVSVFLLSQVGEKRARDLLLTGRIIDAAEAHALGLVTRVIGATELEAAVEELAAALLRNSPTSLQATKRLLSNGARERLDALLGDAVASNAELRGTPDFREGLAAFLGKREPVWPSRAAQKPNKSAR